MNQICTHASNPIVLVCILKLYKPVMSCKPIVKLTNFCCFGTLQHILMAKLNGSFISHPGPVSSLPDAAPNISFSITGSLITLFQNCLSVLQRCLRPSGGLVSSCPSPSDTWYVRMSSPRQIYSCTFFWLTFLRFIHCLWNFLAFFLWLVLFSDLAVDL